MILQLPAVYPRVAHQTVSFVGLFPLWYHSPGQPSVQAGPLICCQLIEESFCEKGGGANRGLKKTLGCSARALESATVVMAVGEEVQPREHVPGFQLPGVTHSSPSCPSPALHLCPDLISCDLHPPFLVTWYFLFLQPFEAVT